MTLNPSGHAINRMPRRKRSRQYVIVGLSARKLRRAQEAINRKAAKKATTVDTASTDRIDQGNVR
jgi:hypothetical protein